MASQHAYKLSSDMAIGGWREALRGRRGVPLSEIQGLHSLASAGITAVLDRIGCIVARTAATPAKHFAQHAERVQVAPGPAPLVVRVGLPLLLVPIVNLPDVSTQAGLVVQRAVNAELAGDVCSP